MKKLLIASGLISIAVLGALAGKTTRTASAQSPGREFLPLQLEEQITVPSVAGRLDHFSADVKRKRLFVSALGNDSLEVIDTSSIGLRTGFYYAKRDRLYVGVPAKGSEPAQVWTYEAED